jgi:hypothetical protein
MRRFAVVVVILSMAVMAQAQHSHGDHDAMNERGTKAMGFDQEKTAHHFLLTSNGGVIDVSAKSAADEKSLNQIRKHLRFIAGEFKRGNFEIPGFIHAVTPDGVPRMKRLKEQISYDYAETAAGARLNITSVHKDATEAIHSFLRFQITDHKTGDSLKVAAAE